MGNMSMHAARSNRKRSTVRPTPEVKINSALRTSHANSKEPLRKCVRDAIDNYFAQLDGHTCNGLYRLVIGEVEAPLFEAVMLNAEGNQTLAAEMLGISRGTLRKKLKEYGLS